jgi:MFS family permease
MPHPIRRQSLGQIALVVRDYDEALAFYVGKLGFTLVEDTPVPEQGKRWVLIAPPGSSGCRILLAQASAPEQVTRIGNQTGGRVFLFLFTGSVAAGTFFGGPIGDRIGRKAVLWASVLGALPFTLALPYANLFWTGVLVVVIGLILASTFSVILVYAQELLPGKTGLVAGIFLGLAFGLSGVGAAALGKLADMTSISFVYSVCSVLPAAGILVMFLPDIRNEVRS